MRNSSDTFLGSAIALIVAFPFLIACSLLPASPLTQPPCADLFRREPSVGDIPGDPYIPPDARVTPLATPEVTSMPTPQVVCPATLDILLIENIEGVPSDHNGTFQLSPSGQQFAYHAFSDDILLLFDLNAGARKEFEAPGIPLFWTDERTLFIIDAPSPGERDGEWYSLDTITGQRTVFEQRWEYDGPRLERFPGVLYTGWQAASALQVKEEVICNAVREGKLHPVAATDGSLLLQRDELLARGAEIVRAEYGAHLLSSDEITLLKERAGETMTVNRVWSQGALEPTYDINTWHILILTGLPEEPHNMLIQVSNEKHWRGLPLVVNQTRIVGGATKQPDADIHPRFFVTFNLCSPEVKKGPEREFILYRKEHGGGPLSPIGIIPFKDLYGWTINDDGEMVWSPDGRYIYMDEWLHGHYRLFRLKLPDQ